VNTKDVETYGAEIRENEKTLLDCINKSFEKTQSSICDICSKEFENYHNSKKYSDFEQVKSAINESAKNMLKEYHRKAFGENKEILELFD
jgi:hypothetical protein